MKEPKFFCTSCARSANHQSLLCKPAALPAMSDIKSKTEGGEGKNIDFSSLKPKKIRKAHKRYKKAAKKLKKLEKKQKRLLKRARKIYASIKGFENISLAESEHLHRKQIH
ncbi:hypothetical protein [Vibrio quintilis]|uniref:hypothetical protein n=1 Tax=Vibrio quintilis TaxID=1117707 RepID=UPI001160F18A|nr:hypothetical protein [Vibrio quintilis]